MYPLSNRTCQAARPCGVSEEGVSRLYAWMLSPLAAIDSNSAVMKRHSVISRPATTTTWPHAGYRQWVDGPQQSALRQGTVQSLRLTGLLPRCLSWPWVMASRVTTANDHYSGIEGRQTNQAVNQETFKVTWITSRFHKDHTDDNMTPSVT